MQNLIVFGFISVIIMISPLISHILKTPLVAVEILLGMGAFYFGIIEHSNELKVVAKVGFLYLMFLAGMEVDLRSFLSIGKSLLKRAIIYFAILYSLTIILVLYMELPAIYIVAFPVISIGMVMTLIQDYGKQQPWLDLALKMGVVGELLSISALVIINGAYSFGLTFDLYKTLAVLLAFLLVIILLFRFVKIVFWWFPSLKLLFIPHENSMNQDIRFSMMLFFVMIGIVLYLELDVVLGAFLAGMFLATFFQYKRDLPEKLHEFGFGFFVPLFFIYVGSTLDLSIIMGKPELMRHALFITFAMITIRLVAASFAYGRYFKSAKNTLLFALSDSMPLTFLVATATLGIQLEAITQMEYYSFVIAALLEGVIFTLAIKGIHVLDSKRVNRE
ncbi:MAG: cation:proton antiporter [Wolinella sp.]